MPTDTGCTVRAVAPSAAALHRNRLRSIFRDAVLFSASTRYSSEHVVAWSMAADDIDRWDERLARGRTWIASRKDVDDPDAVTGFALLQPGDHIDLLYVDPEWSRRGIGDSLLAAVEEDAIARGLAALTADASLVAEPLFLRRAYDATLREEIIRDGLAFARVRMRKALR